MHWNYRLTKQKIFNPLWKVETHGEDGEYEVEYCMREIYYEDGKISWTEREISPHGETEEEFHKSLDLYLDGIYGHPVIDLNEVEANGYLYIEPESEFSKGLRVERESW